MTDADAQWERVPSGLAIRYAPGRMLVVSDRLGRFRLCDVGPGGAVPVADAQTVAGAWSLGRSRARASARSASWSSLVLETQDVASVGRFSITVGKSENGDVMASVKDVDGRVLGHGRFELVDWRGSHSIGTAALAGTVRLDEILPAGTEGAVRDAVERTTGFVTVPQGVNGVRGALTAEESVFWTDRALTRRVPGWGDAEAARRLAEVDAATTLVHAEAHAPSPEFALEVSALTGWPIRGVAGEGGTPSTAWCVAPSGRAFVPGGFLDEDAISDGRTVMDYDWEDLDDRIGSGALEGFFVRCRTRAGECARMVLEARGVAVREQAWTPAP